MRRRTHLTAILTPILPIDRVVLIPQTPMLPSFDFHQYMADVMRRILYPLDLRAIMNAQPTTIGGPTL